MNLPNLNINLVHVKDILTYMTGGLLSEVQIYRNIGLFSYKSGLI